MVSGMKRRCVVMVILSFFPGLCCSGGAAAEPGLRLELHHQQGGQVDLRASRQAALFVPEGMPASPFLAPGPFTASFTGFLNLETRSRLYFSFAGRGSATLTVNQEVLLRVSGEDLSVKTSERTRINPGAIPIRIDYASPADGDAAFRFFWEERTFAREAVPMHAFSHNRDKALQGQLELRQGRVLFAKHRCIQCHQPTVEGFNPRNVMPELVEIGPDFAEIGQRLKPSWMAQWIISPRALRPRARMPALGLTKGEAQDIAAYLASVKGPGKPRAIQGDTGGGAALFNDLGCISCHQLDPDESFTRVVPSISLAAVHAKYHDLPAFLRAPARHYPGIRMPDFKLSREEADALAVYLQGMGTKAIDQGAGGDAVKGRALVQERGCLNCHQHPLENRYVSPSLEQIAESDWAENGCLSADPTVRLNLQASEKTVLIAFKAGLGSLKQRNLAEYGERQVTRLKCAACHSRDRRPSQWDRLEDAGYLGSHPKVPGEPGEAATADDTQHVLAKIPTLDLPGEMLHQDWMRDLFAGKHAYRSRAWLKKRMPAFASRAGLLAEGLALGAGVHDESVVAAAADPEQVKLGEQLIGPQGFACVACHGIKDQKPLAVFEGQGINFAYTVPRVRREYYHRWMLDPQRLDPTSIMPRYAGEDGTTPLKDLLGGSATNQFNAIWQYLGTVQGEEVYPSR
jgi:mono/diheme cytochrome c family protein